MALSQKAAAVLINGFASAVGVAIEAVDADISNTIAADIEKMQILLDDVRSDIRLGMARKAQVRGIGGYVPDKVLSNADLAEIMDRDEWIVSRSGIHQRHQAEDSVMASDLGVIAQNALAMRA